MTAYVLMAHKTRIVYLEEGHFFSSDASVFPVAVSKDAHALFEMGREMKERAKGKFEMSYEVFPVSVEGEI